MGLGIGVGACLINPTSPDCLVPVGGTVAKVGGAVGNAINFANDPLGYIAQKMQQAAAGLSETVLPQLEKLTHPDLSLDWFRSSYSVSFALAILVFVAFLGWNFVLLARRRVSGDEVVETLAFYTPLFFGGCLLGPVLGTMVLALTGAITDSLITWGVSGSVDSTTKALQAAIAAGDSAKIVGGAIVSIVLFACLILALLVSFLVLLVMLVTLYLTGAIIPLSLVWLTNPRQRDKGLKVVMVWVGVCFSHVLLFLLLGLAFRMVAGLATSFDQPGMTILANLAVATIALLLATLSPLGLLAFAPVGPSAAGAGGAGGPSLSVPGQRSPVGGYDASSADSQTAQLARDGGSAGDGGGGGADDAGSDAGGDGGGAAGGGLLGMLQARRGGGSSAAMEPAGGHTDDDDGDADDGDGDSGGGDSRALTAAPRAPQAGAEGAVQDDEDDDWPALTEQSAGGDSAGADSAAAGKSRVGVLPAAVAVARSSAELAQSAGDMAAEHMEHADTDLRGGSRADTRPRR